MAFGHGMVLFIVEVTPIYSLTWRIIDVNFFLSWFTLAGGNISASRENQADIGIHVQVTIGCLSASPGCVGVKLGGECENLFVEGINDQVEEIARSSKTDHNPLVGFIFNFKAGFYDLGRSSGK